MLKVAILNAKGGVGKTLACTQLAVRALANFERVGIADLDPSGGARRWFEARTKSGAGFMPQLFVGVSDPEDALNACNLDGMNVVIMDGAPGTIDATRSVIGMVDLVLIPEKCSDDDIQSSAMVARMCKDANVPAIGIVNDVPLASDNKPYQLEMANKIAESIRAYGMECVTLRNRDVYLRAKNAGLGVHEIKGRTSSEAKKEINQLYDLMIAALAERVGA